MGGSVLARMGRAWRSYRAKARLLAPRMSLKANYFYANTLRYPELDERSTGGIELTPYQGLADFWHAFARPRQPDYPSFLLHLADDRGFRLGSILDLACGTGTLTERLAAIAPEVVGLDASDPMLARARECCATHPGVTLVRADFRAFELAHRFDAAVCAGNSLNYVADVQELGAVFRRVAAHLRPGGVFVFDTFTDYGMRLLSGTYCHFEADGRRFALRSSYDPTLRQQTAAALVADGVELHRRIPLDPYEVVMAAEGSGLRLDDYFSDPWVPGRKYVGIDCFFVLRRAG